tara:strand:+ start:10928 stop:11308 length:381 start_codon:yes stop_codon:yes gene_type:complete
MILNILKLSLIFSALDFVYLFSMSNKFQNMIKKIQGSDLQMNIIPTIFCYFFLIFLLYYFIVHKKQTVLDAFLLGLGVYGVYETTNLAIFKKWEPMVGIVDTLWGGILFSLSYYLYLRFFNTISRN